MPSREPSLLPESIRRIPADLAAVLGLVVLTNLAVFLPVVRGTPLRLVVGLPFVLFVPGYALVAALFPEAGGPVPTDGGGTRPGSQGIDGIERVALSVGLSIAVVPLVGLLLNFTPWGIRLVPVMLAVSGVTVGLTALAISRRWACPEAERFAVPYRRWVRNGRVELFDPDSKSDAALNALLIVSLLVAASSVAFAVAVPQQGESFTEFYLLTENDTGDRVAADYPTEFERGESRELIVGIGNHEHEQRQYTVVAQLQRVETVDNRTRVQEATEVARYRTTLAHNETWERPHTITPRMTGERLRLQYLLYEGEPATPPNRSAASRELHLWVNVSR